jgi:oxaloacetate decarboxylase beta subunit
MIHLAFIDLKEMFFNTGFAHLQWQMFLMWAVVAVLFYLAIVKGFEPLLLIPISIGALIANLPVQEFIFQAPSAGSPGGLFWYLKQGLDLGIYPPLIFLGVGAMIDFGPLIANPRTLLLGGAAQFGIFATFVCAPLLGFDLLEAASIGIIGGADGPTSIFVTTKLAPHLLGPVAVAAYSYMALVPLIQPPIMKLLTTEAERKIRMKTLRKVSQLEKIAFAAVVMVFCILVVPDAAPLIAMLFAGNLLRECKVTERLVKAAQNEIINIVTIFLGLCVGTKMGGFKEKILANGAVVETHNFLNSQTLGILALGVIAFAAATAAGVLMAKLMNVFSKNKINPLIGSAGVSAVPMAARVSHDVGMKADPSNYLLMHAMGPNVAGVIGSALAAGYFLSLLK